MSYCRASSAKVRSPFIAASGTDALNAGEWFRRFPLAMLSLSFKAAHAASCESKAITHRPVQLFGVISPAACCSGKLCLPVRAGRCDLGIWQGVYLWEHRSAGHRRRLTLTVYGE